MVAKRYASRTAPPMCWNCCRSCARKHDVYWWNSLPCWMYIKPSPPSDVWPKPMWWQSRGSAKRFYCCAICKCCKCNKTLFLHLPQTKSPKPQRAGFVPVRKGHLPSPSRKSKQPSAQWQRKSKDFSTNPMQRWWRQEDTKHSEFALGCRNSTPTPNSMLVRRQTSPCRLAVSAS